MGRLIYLQNEENRYEITIENLNGVQSLAEKLTALKAENDRLRFIIDNGLGREDLQM